MFNNYDAYKDSGVQWIGEIPSEWGVLRAKNLFNFRKIINSKYQCDNVLSLTLRGVVNNSFDNPEGLIPKDYATYQIFNKNDLVFKLIDLENISTSRVGLVHEKGIMSPAYIRLECKETVIPKFAYYYFYNLYLQTVFNKLGAGVRSTLSQKDLLELPYLHLCKEQQIKIVDFLETKILEIDQAIAIKEQQIVLLNERKQIVIQKAVTQGLNPNVATKDSGVEWIGQIPEHWKCVKLKYFIDLIPGYAFKSEEYSSNDKDIKLLRGINVSPNQIKWSETVYWPSEKVDMYEEYLLQEGDIVIAMDRPWVSGGIRIAEIGKHDLPALLLQRVARMRSKVGISNKYLKILLTNDLFLAYFTPMLTGISVPHISGDQIENFICPLPSIDEQNQIIQYLEHNLSEIKKAKELLLTQIEKLKEYKTTLINDAVTGKIKVA